MEKTPLDIAQEELTKAREALARAEQKVKEAMKPKPNYNYESEAGMFLLIDENSSRIRLVTKTEGATKGIALSSQIQELEFIDSWVMNPRSRGTKKYKLEPTDLQALLQYVKDSFGHKAV